MCEILIPTCKPPRPEQIDAIQANTPGAEIIVSGLDASAAVNRNWCLERAKGSIVIMLDDDISGFFPTWHERLMRPIKRDHLVCMVSARLMTSDGLVAPTCSRCYDLEPKEIEVQPNDHCVLPTAAVAFRNLGIRFDEYFKGSGWEDNDWCFQYREQLPGAKFVQSNRCRLIHANEQKAQAPYWAHNRDYFRWKWRHTACPQSS